MARASKSQAPAPPLTPTLATRYDRVKEILDDAAGASAAEYGGVGRFWQLPLERFLEIEIAGVRMIAPATTAMPAAAAAHSCCGHSSAQSPSGEPAGVLHAGRGARSGLVRGLRGLSPFDGSRFPALPWGGTPVAANDTEFISDWIDDGCPATERELASLPVSMATSQSALETIPADNVEVIVRDVYSVYSANGGANEYKYQRGELKQRMNLDCMSEDQIERLRYAFREMYALNKWPEDRRSYNNMALIHQNHCQHGWERFLPWHRIYLYEFEQALQDQVPDVTMPYWDWTMPQYRPECPEKGWIIPPSFKSFLTDTSVDWLKRATPKLPAAAADVVAKKMVGKRYTSPQDFFADVTALIGPEYATGDHRNRFIDALLDANSLWYPLRYPAEYPNKQTINQAIHYHYPSVDDIEQIMSVRSFRDFGGGSLYNDSFGFIDQNPHNTMHIWSGGMNPDAATSAPDTKEALADRNRGVRVAGRRFHAREDMYVQAPFGDMLSNLTASYDPIFWPVHGNVDRLWSEWQSLHPNANPADLDSVLTPWSYTIADTLDVSRFGYEYVKSTFLIPVGMEAPVGRFVSKPIAVPEPVRASFRQAEVRLHRIPQLERSCFIRVFLNLPDANAATPIDHANYAGYLAIFGHGPCYGGPGHCAVPESPRKFDLRPRSHNTPRNHRINVTKSARRLLDAGATSLQMTLVTIGVDYCEENDLLRLDGVSLNFFD